MAAQRILVVDDEKSLCTMLEMLLRREGFQVVISNTVEDAFEKLSRSRFDAVLTDLMIGTQSGMKIVQSLNGTGIPVLLMTAYGTTQNAVDAFRLGIADFVFKPIDPLEEKLIKPLRRALERSPQDKPRSAESHMSTPDVNQLETEVGGQSTIAKDLRTKISKVAPTESTVLLTGESGTGKEVVARALHRFSSRAACPFLPIHCAALSEGLLESELFGHVKGAFTGAVSDSLGLFVAAKGGTVFLDEIGEIPLSTQVKLLRVLQERVVTPVGGIESRSINARIIAATNADLENLVSRGLFREDLFYRLNVIRIRTPALRSRKEDLPTLVDALLERIVRRLGRTAPVVLSPGAKGKLKSYDWPGNIRELENVLERSMVLCDGNRLEESDIALGSGSGPELRCLDGASPTLDEVQKAYIFWILAKTKWLLPQAAATLGIEPERLQRMIQHYGINDPRT